MRTEYVRSKQRFCFNWHGGTLKAAGTVRTGEYIDQFKWFPALRSSVPSHSANWPFSNEFGCDNALVTIALDVVIASGVDRHTFRVRMRRRFLVSCKVGG